MAAQRRIVRATVRILASDLFLCYDQIIIFNENLLGQKTDELDKESDTDTLNKWTEAENNQEEQADYNQDITNDINENIDNNIGNSVKEDDYHDSDENSKTLNKNEVEDDTLNNSDNSIQEITNEQKDLEAEPQENINDIHDNNNNPKVDLNNQPNIDSYKNMFDENGKFNRELIREELTKDEYTDVEQAGIPEGANEAQYDHIRTPLYTIRLTSAYEDNLKGSHLQNKYMQKWAMDEFVAGRMKPGEMGNGIVLEDMTIDEDTKKELMFIDHAFSEYISEMISVNRSLPDRWVLLVSFTHNQSCYCTCGTLFYSLNVNRQILFIQCKCVRSVREAIRIFDILDIVPTS